MRRARKIKHPELYRARLSCQVGREALEGTTIPPPMCSALDYAVFNLLHAVEDIAKFLERDEDQQ